MAYVPSKPNAKEWNNVRHATMQDLEEVVEINNQFREIVGEKQEDFFRRYINLTRFYVAENNQGGERLTGFVLAMRENSKYDSPNFAWFQRNFDQFIYIDRIVVSNAARKYGIGSLLYSELLKNKGKYPIVCEVSPKNLDSIRFHERRGFQYVDTFQVQGKLQRAYVL